MKHEQVIDGKCALGDVAGDVFHRQGSIPNLEDHQREQECKGEVRQAPKG